MDTGSKMNSKFHRAEDSFATVAVHAGYSPEDRSPDMPIVEPLVCSSTFKQPKPGVFKYEYGRTGNPCRNNLEKRLAALEGAKYAATFPSGVCVTFAIGQLFKPGSHFVISNDIYGGTMKCFVNMEQRNGFEVDYVDFTDLKSLKNHLRSDTKLMWFETPTNPTLTLVDIKAVCDLAKSVAQDVVIVLDNTFLSPYFQRPLELGATVSMYSLTKYVNGHADVVMGAAVTNSEELHKELEFMQEANGLCPSPFDCYQVTRGSKTLPLRMEQHHKNSTKIAQFLEKNSYVTKVNHPGLASHPNHELAVRQASGHSGLMSFCIKGGLKEVNKFIDNLKLIQLAPSLGGVETLIAVPVLMTHYMISKEKRDKIGITDSLIRLSVGIEKAEDLISDIEQALKATYL